MTVTGTEQRIYGTLLNKRPLNSIIFIFDLTGSMYGQEGYVKTISREISRLIMNDKTSPYYNPKASVAIIAHGDTLGSVYLFSNDYTTVYNNITNAWSDGGGDNKERHLGAVYWSQNDFYTTYYPSYTEREKSNITIIQIGNTGSYTDYINAHGIEIDIPTLSTQLLNRNIYFITIYEFEYGYYGYYNMGTFANTVNGLYIPSFNQYTAVGILDAITAWFNN